MPKYIWMYCKRCQFDMKTFPWLSVHVMAPHKKTYVMKLREEQGAVSSLLVFYGNKVQCNGHKFRVHLVNYAFIFAPTNMSIQYLNPVSSYCKILSKKRRLITVQLEQDHNSIFTMVAQCGQWNPFSCGNITLIYMIWIVGCFVGKNTKNYL